MKTTAMVGMSMGVRVCRQEYICDPPPPNEAYVVNKKIKVLR